MTYTQTTNTFLVHIYVIYTNVQSLPYKQEERLRTLVELSLLQLFLFYLPIQRKLCLILQLHDL